VLTQSIPTVGFGFSPTAVFRQVVDFGSNCESEIFISGSDEYAYVQIYTTGTPDFRVASGAYFAPGGVIDTRLAAVDVAFLATCLGTAQGNISGLTQNGADGTYASDTEMYISFTLLSATAFLPAGTYTIDLINGFSVSTPDTEAPVLTAPADQTANTDAGVNTASLDVTGLGSVSDNQDSGLAITYRVGATVLSGAYDFPLGATTVTMDAVDGAGNTATQVSFTVTVAISDTQAPDVVIRGEPEKPAAPDSFSVTIEFSEAVIGFAATDIVVNNGSVTRLTGSGASYGARISSAGTGDVSLSVPAGAAEDAAGNESTASNTLVIADFTVEETQTTIASFMYDRVNQLVLNQPNLTRFLRGATGGTLNANVTRGRGSFDLETDAERNVWFQLQGTWSNTNTRDSTYIFGAVGGHIKARENLLLGAMLQFDDQSQGDGTASAEGTGWLVGPYFVTKLPDQPLYFEGRLLYGQSSNSVSAFGTYEDDFDTARFLAQVQVTGEYNYGRNVFSPYLNVTHTEDKQGSYTDTLGNDISEQSVTLQQIAFGLDASRLVPLQNAELEWSGGLAGAWSSTSGTEVAETVIPSYEDWRAKLTTGLDYRHDTRGSVSVSAFFDGLGANGYESYGLNIGYRLDF
jgi:hypothetical protein